MERGRFALILIAFGWSVVVAHGFDKPEAKPTDEEIRRLLVGRWHGDDKFPNGMRAFGTMHYKDDGTVESEVIVGEGERSVRFTMSGTWKIANGAIVMAITKSNTPGPMAGKTITSTVLSIDEKTLRIRSEQGRENIRTRIPE